MNWFLLFLSIIIPLLLILFNFEYISSLHLTSKDLNQINIQKIIEPSQLNNIKNKNSLIIGGTRGIGRGIALTLAEAGSNVVIVGRSDGNEIIKQMKKLNNNQTFSSESADLTSIKHCIQLTERLKMKYKPFDIVVFTVGTWPDLKNLYTSEGINRVVAIDLFARFTILYKLLPYLSTNARILSVLASTHQTPQPSSQNLRNIITGTISPSLFDMFYMGPTMDAIFIHAAKLYPSITFIGTYPGFVETDLLTATFPKWFVDFLYNAGKFIGIILSEKESGLRHSSILDHDKFFGNVIFYDDTPIARYAHSSAYDIKLQNWLWNYLKNLVEHNSYKYF